MPKVASRTNVDTASTRRTSTKEAAPKKKAVTAEPAAEPKAGWKPKTPSSKTVDKVQGWVDNATAAGGAAGFAMTATVVAAPVGIATSLLAEAATIANAGVDLVQAGKAALDGDKRETKKQLLEAGRRAISAIPLVGPAVAGGRMAAKLGVDVAEKAEAVANKAADKLAAQVSTVAVETIKRKKS